jgi:hypothetical protein
MNAKPKFPSSSKARVDHAPTGRKSAGKRQPPKRTAVASDAPLTDFKSRAPVVVLNDDGPVHVKCMAGDRPLGSDDERFIMGLVSQIINASSKGGTIDKPASDFALSVVQAIDPRDEVEAMLAAQMAAVHMATMTFARRLNNVETIPQQDSAGSLMNKLARTYAAQAEALKKYRSGGEQRITVQHVTVNDGGQAVVGNINAGGKPSREEEGDG